MSQPVRSMSDSSQQSDHFRKRVGKACDRCRLKKSKCDGTSPCSRCRADNAICVFGERRRSHDKVYPKGYVEMLEQQQMQLVTGLQDMYRRLSSVSAWPGAPLNETDGHPLTHDILTTLDIIRPNHDHFEEDPERLQQRLILHGAPMLPRRGSFSSDSDHSVTHGHKRAISVVDSPVQSPAPRVRKSVDGSRHVKTPATAGSPTTMHPTAHKSVKKPSPLHTESPMIEHVPSVEDDALLSAFSWQDLSSNGMQNPEPQFTFPQQPDNLGILDLWGDMSGQTQFDPTFIPTYTAMSTDMTFTDLSQLQKQPWDLNMPVATN